MSKLTKFLRCVLCGKPATFTIQPEGGRISLWCTKHYNEQIKELER